MEVTDCADDRLNLEYPQSLHPARKPQLSLQSGNPQEWSATEIDGWNPDQFALRIRRRMADNRLGPPGRHRPSRQKRVSHGRGLLSKETAF
jgi:hypothetical protein